MSPEARTSTSPTHFWRDAAVGALLATVPAVMVSQIDQASYRTGAAGMAFLVVLGLATRWPVAAGAAPVLLIGITAQVTEDVTVAPSRAGLAGTLVYVASSVVVVFALRRWEGDRRRAREDARSRRRNERRLQALVELGSQLASVADRAGLIATLEVHLTKAAGCDGAMLVISDGPRMRLSMVTGHDARAFPAERSSEIQTRRTPAMDALATGRPVYLPSGDDIAERYPVLRDYTSRAGQHAWAAVPVVGVGALVFTWRDEQVFSPAQRAFLETLAALFGAAAQRVRTVERSELERFVGAFDAMLDGVGIHRAIRDPSGRVFDMEMEYINPAGVLSGRPRDEVVGKRLSELIPGNPLLSSFVHVLETGQPFVLEDVDSSLLLSEDTGVESLSLRVSRLDADRIVFAIRDVSERARLLREIREANEVFAAAQQLAHVGSWRYDFREDRLDWSAELCRIFGVPEGAAPVRRREDAFFGCEHPADRELVNAQVARAIDTKSSFGFDMRIIRQSDGEVRDVTTTGTVLVDEDGNVTGVWGATQDVTERRRAERSRSAALDALARQREAVAGLQRVILPDTLPTVDGAELTAHYRAAALETAVGGDWYDAFLAPDGRLVLAIGDVAGHGLECAALANQLRVSVRVRVNDGMEPGAVLTLLDAELLDAFVTCWLATYEPASRVLRFANAGHLPAMLSRGGATELVAGYTSPPLGTQWVKPVEHELELAPGDLLILATDGLVERRGEDLDAGFERLEHAVPLVAGLGDPAFSLVEELAPDAPDDVCVMTMRILPRAECHSPTTDP